MKQFFYLLSVMLLLICPSLSMAQDTSTVIWEEDFTGWMMLHSTGKNATYKYGGGYSSATKPSIHFGNEAKSFSPELLLPKGTNIQACVSLYGASGKFTLSYEYSFSTKSTSLSVAKGNSSSSITLDKISEGKYTIDVPEGIQVLNLIFTSKNGGCYLDNIRLTASSECRKAGQKAPISFSQSNETVVFGEDYSLQELVNPNDLSVIYWSSDSTVAHFDKYNNLNVNGIGTTTITAIFCGSDEYAYSEASYTLDVKRKAPVGEVFYESFDSNLSSGGYGGIDYVEGTADIIFDNKDVTKTNNIASAYKCIYVENKGTYTINPKIESDVTLSFKIRSGSNSSEKTKLSAYNATLSKSAFVATRPDWSEYTVQISDIKDGCSITFTGGYYFLDDVSIISNKAKDEDFVTVSIGKYGYATLYYGDKTLTVPDGMTAFTMKVEDEQVVESKRYEAGTTIPQATAVVLKADAGEYKLYPSQEEGVTDSSNELKGSDESATTTGGDIYYRLSAHEGNVGFYWGANDGGAFTNGAHKAYLVMSRSSGAKKIRSGYPFHSNTTTWIEEISDNANDDKAPCFNLSGQRVGSNYHGIMIRNGKKIFVK